MNVATILYNIILYWAPIDNNENLSYVEYYTIIYAI